MSVFSAKTGLSSILKAYSPLEKDKAKNAIINKVRFEMPKKKGLLEVVKSVCEMDNYQNLNEFVVYLRETELMDEEFVGIMKDAQKAVNTLSPKFTNLVETLLSLSWSTRSAEAVYGYSEFFIDLMVAHSKYIHFGLNKLIALWIPNDADTELWPNGSPILILNNQLQAVHKLLERLLNAVPMSLDVVLETIENQFPYYKKPAHVVAGYVHNVLWLMSYKPIFTKFVMELLLKKMVMLDVNAPRSEIEAECNDDSDTESQEDDSGEVFQMDDCNDTENTSMCHPIAQTLDICMDKLISFLDSKNSTQIELQSNPDEKLEKQTETINFLKVLLSAFDNVILPCHNTHHVQFLIFYYCSFKPSFTDVFLQSLWEKVRNPNVSAVIRQTAVGYISSFLARSKFSNLTVLKHYLRELCSWAHQYIQNSDQYRSAGSLKANLIFFSVCQAIFYVIAFRSSDLTADKKSLLFLQRLQLSALVTCNFNPLRVCLPAVATAFAGVTRAYQLAYCHAILERNARRKLATVYANDIATPEATLDTFFPFDPYLLKISCARINPLYLQYKAHEIEEEESHLKAEFVRRKRGDSEMMDDLDEDDFLKAEKRQRLLSGAKSFTQGESPFTYGLSPGFHA